MSKPEILRTDKTNVIVKICAGVAEWKCAGLEHDEYRDPVSLMGLLGSNPNPGAFFGQNLA